MTSTGIIHRRLAANGSAFHLTESGGDGPPVLLLHGFPQHAHAWRHVQADLGREHHVYALDLRGSGESEAPRSGYDTDTRVADVLAVLDGLRLEKVTLVGHQFGGWLGFNVALAAPERLHALVAVNTPHPWLSRRSQLPQAWRYWYTALFEYPLLGSWVIRTRPGLLRWFLRRGRDAVSTDELDLYVDPLRDPARARAGQQLHWQVVQHDIPRRLLGHYRRRQLTVPTLLLAGTRDFALSPRGLADTGNLTVRVLEGGHWLPDERPDDVSAAVREMTGQLTTTRRHP